MINYGNKRKNHLANSQPGAGQVKFYQKWQFWALVLGVLAGVKISSSDFNSGVKSSGLIITIAIAFSRSSKPSSNGSDETAGKHVSVPGSQPPSTTALQPKKTTTAPSSGAVLPSSNVTTDHGRRDFDPAPPTKNLRSSTKDLYDARSWKPFNDPKFRGLDIYMFDQNLTMHFAGNNNCDFAGSNCGPDTAIRALMTVDPGEWGYRNLAELKQRVQKLRTTIGAAPTGAITTEGTGPGKMGLRRLFARYGIAIVFVKTVSGQPTLTELKPFLPKSQEKAVTKYYLWSTEATTRDRTAGIGYSDALATKVGNDFKLLLTRQEFMNLYKNVCPPTGGIYDVLRRKELCLGREMHNETRCSFTS